MILKGIEKKRTIRGNVEFDCVQIGRVDLSDNLSIVCQRFKNGTTQVLDLRKWVAHRTTGELMASRSGLQINLRDFVEKVLPMLTAFVSTIDAPAQPDGYKNA